LFVLGVDGIVAQLRLTDNARRPGCTRGRGSWS
jgi:hypothetical protein